MAGDDTATLVLRERENFGDRFAAVRAWSVPTSERYPEGVKYSFQYGTVDGETVVRYDNFPDHPDATTHHKHTPDGVESVDFEGIRALYHRFKAEVNDHGHDWD